MKKLVFFIAIIFCFFSSVLSEEIFASISIYGPNISHDILKVLSRSFSKKTGITVSIVSGHSSFFKRILHEKADIVYNVADIFGSSTLYQSHFYVSNSRKCEKFVDDFVVYIDKDDSLDLYDFLNMEEITRKRALFNKNQDGTFSIFNVNNLIRRLKISALTNKSEVLKFMSFLKSHNVSDTLLSKGWYFNIV